MPVTKTATRALRVSKRKTAINKIKMAELEVAIRLAKKLKTKKAIENAISKIDINAKNNRFHKNKAARLKSQLSKLLPKSKPSPKKSK